MMKRTMTTKMVMYMAALAMILPVAMTAGEGEAQAVTRVSSSRSGGKRTHKAASSSKRSSSSSSSRSSSSSTRRTTTSGRTTYQSSSPTRTTTTRYRRPAGSTTSGRTTTTTTSRTRVNERPRYGSPSNQRTTVVVSGGRRTTTTTTTTTTRSNRTRYYNNGPVYYAPAPRRTTVVNNNYYYGQTQQQPPAQVYEEDRCCQDTSDDRAQAYITANMGLSAMLAPKISDQALPGVDFNLGLGGRSEWLALEMGFGMGGYRLDPNADSSDFLVLGTSLDLKLQPSILGVIEPYVMAGVGGQYFRDSVVDTSALGGSLRLGAGLDLRFDDLALTMRYTFSQHGWLEDDKGVYPDGSLSAQTESIGIGLTLYF